MPLEKSTDLQIKSNMLYSAMQLNKIFYRENKKSINKPKCQITIKTKALNFHFRLFPEAFKKEKNGEWGWRKYTQEEDNIKKYR